MKRFSCTPDPSSGRELPVKAWLLDGRRWKQFPALLLQPGELVQVEAEANSVLALVALDPSKNALTPIPFTLVAAALPLSSATGKELADADG